MKITLLGTITCDTIFQPQGGSSESYGGLIYSILPLAMLAVPGTIIVPVVNLGRDVESPVRAILSRHKQISQGGIRVVPERNNRVVLRYISEGEREEMQQGDLPPLTFEQIEPFLDADVLLVNFISGSDLSWRLFKRSETIHRRPCIPTSTACRWASILRGAASRGRSRSGINGPLRPMWSR